MIAVLSFGLFVVLGGVASFEDWKERKIRNSLLAMGLGAGAALLFYLLLNTLLGYGHLRLWGMGEYYLPWRYYPKFLAHFLLSLAAGVAFWRLSVWPAGDAKLYTVFAFLAALIDPNLAGFPFFLFLMILINIFVPAGLVFAVETVVKVALLAPALRTVDWPKWRKAKLEVLDIRLRELWPYRVEYLVLAVNLVALFFLVQEGQRRFLQFLQEPLRTLSVFVFMFVFWSPLVSVLRNKKVGLAAFCALSAWMILGTFVWRLPLGARLFSALKMMLNFTMFLSIGRVFFTWFIERESLRELQVEQVKQGVILSDSTWEQLSREDELAGKMEERYVDGLTHRDAETLRTWLIRRGTADYTVYQTIPFAFWIFLGTLLSVTGRANAVTLITPYLSRSWDLCRAAAGRLFS